MLLDQPRYVSADEQKRENERGHTAGSDDGSDIVAGFRALEQQFKQK
jgi:hypothetical protein